MIKLSRTNSRNEDFIWLVNQLDNELAIRDGTDHEFYQQYNTIDDIKYAILIKIGDRAVSCGALKKFSSNTFEVKRMYTLPEFRGQGLAKKLLLELEMWGKELGYSTSILETGKRNPEAISLYINYGYQIIPNYGQYVGIDNSVCFQKIIT